LLFDMTNFYLNLCLTKMDAPPLLNHNLKKDVENYIKTEIDYLEVSGIAKLVSVLSRIYFTCLIILFVCICILSLLLGIAWWVGDKVSNYTLGFVFIAVLIITGLSFLTIFQNAFLRIFRNKLISAIYT